MSDSIKKSLLAKVARLELSAERGLHLNTIEELKSGPGMLISPERCNNMMANCRMFRKWINECFERPATQSSPSKTPAEVAGAIAESLGFSVSQDR